MTVAVRAQVGGVEPALGVRSHILDVVYIDRGPATPGHGADRMLDDEASAQLAPLAIIAALARRWALGILDALALAFVARSLIRRLGE
jgi:hypothetical protein